MTTVARLSVWVPPERMDEFEEAYKRQLAPILQRHGLVEFSERGRTTVDTVFSRLFAFDQPRLIAAAEQALEQDSAWQELLQGLGARFGTTGEDGILRHSLRVYAAPAGPGKTVEAGAGIQQGLWQSFGIKEGLASPTVFDILQDRAGHLWLATYKGALSIGPERIAIREYSSRYSPS